MNTDEHGWDSEGFRWIFTNLIPMTFARCPCLAFWPLIYPCLSVFIRGF